MILIIFCIFPETKILVKFIFLIFFLFLIKALIILVNINEKIKRNVFKRITRRYNQCSFHEYEDLSVQLNAKFDLYFYFKKNIVTGLICNICSCNSIK